MLPIVSRRKVEIVKLVKRNCLFEMINVCSSVSLAEIARVFPGTDEAEIADLIKMSGGLSSHRIDAVKGLVLKLQTDSIALARAKIDLAEEQGVWQEYANLVKVKVDNDSKRIDFTGLHIRGTDVRASDRRTQHMNL